MSTKRIFLFIFVVLVVLAKGCIGVSPAHAPLDKDSAASKGRPKSTAPVITVGETCTPSPALSSCQSN